MQDIPHHFFLIYTLRNFSQASFLLIVQRVVNLTIWGIYLPTEYSTLDSDLKIPQVDFPSSFHLLFQNCEFLVNLYTRAHEANKSHIVSRHLVASILLFTHFLCDKNNFDNFHLFCFKLQCMKVTF